jgi:hypothetical protein
MGFARGRSEILHQLEKKQKAKYFKGFKLNFGEKIRVKSNGEPGIQ